MNTDTLIENWKIFFQDRGIPDALVSEYVSYVEILLLHDAPVIFELEHLSKLWGIEYSELCKIINATEVFYRVFQIPKRRGGFRQIHAPYPSLLSCQSWIYENILKSGKVHPCAQGFAPKKSILTNAHPHLNSPALLKLDLENFFPSVPINWVIQHFLSLGYARNIAFYLAKICCFQGGLAQGAPTSPALSNILLYSLDKRLDLLSQKFELKYTRYADDMTFSGRYISAQFLEIVESIIDDFGLVLNKSKSRLHTKLGQRIVTGISVVGDTLKLPKSKKRELRQEIHLIRKYGYISYISKKKINKPNYLASLQGRIQFWLQIEPNNEFALDALSYIKNLDKRLTE